MVRRYTLAGFQLKTRGTRQIRAQPNGWDIAWWGQTVRIGPGLYLEFAIHGWTTGIRTTDDASRLCTVLQSIFDQPD
jgi:hypothetical protein